MKYFSNLDLFAVIRCRKWYDDCKLGIFIHWGPYSCPGVCAEERTAWYD